jgi:hypothetical protein
MREGGAEFSHDGYHGRRGFEGKGLWGVRQRGRNLQKVSTPHPQQDQITFANAKLSSPRREETGSPIQVSDRG